MADDTEILSININGFNKELNKFVEKAASDAYKKLINSMSDNANNVKNNELPNVDEPIDKVATEVIGRSKEILDIDIIVKQATTEVLNKIQPLLEKLEKISSAENQSNNTLISGTNDKLVSLIQGRLNNNSRYQDKLNLQQKIFAKGANINNE